MWTIARVSIMATAFTLLSLAYFIHADNLKNAFWVAWLWLLLALFSYESIWNIIPIFFLVSWYKTKLGSINKSTALLQSVVMGASFLAYLAIRFLLLDSLVGDGYKDMEDNLMDMKLVFGNLVKLTARIFTPAIDHPGLFTTLFLLGVLVFSIFIYNQFKIDRKTGVILIILWVAMISGVITAAPLGIDTHFHESDRYTYYASFYFCLFAVILCHSFSPVVLKNLLSGLVFLIFVFCFNNLQRDYAYSSAVTRQTIDFVNKQPAGKSLVFIDIPDRYKGALIFRVALPHGIEWLCPDHLADTVIEYNHTRDFQSNGNFKTGQISLEDLKIAKGEPFLRDFNIFLSRAGLKNPAILWYGKDGLWLVK